jgi:hypothetical protein
MRGYSGSGSTIMATSTSIVVLRMAYMTIEIICVYWMVSVRSCYIFMTIFAFRKFFISITLNNFLPVPCNSSFLWQLRQLNPAFVRWTSGWVPFLHLKMHVHTWWMAYNTSIIISGFLKFCPCANPPPRVWSVHMAISTACVANRTVFNCNPADVLRQLCKIISST